MKKKTVKLLRKMLKHNDQVQTGKKAELLDKVANRIVIINQIIIIKNRSLEIFLDVHTALEGDLNTPMTMNI